MEKVNWADLVRNKVSHRAKVDRNILHTINREKANLDLSQLASQLSTKTRY
jgi:hypothetical protein